MLLKAMKGKKVAIAFSGGVDSSLVAKASIDAGIDSIAITISSPLMAESSLKNARKIAKEIGIEHVIAYEELEEMVRKNPYNRCYFCKKSSAKLWKKIAKERGFDIVADGINADEIKNEFYYGIKALDEEGIWHPLAELNFSKKEVREVAHKIGLSNWNIPSDSCLASRIAYGEEIEEKKLKMIEKAEDYLRKFSPVVRLRLHGKIARIEVDEKDIEKLFYAKEEVIKELKRIGFKYITIDLEGYREGSMNERGKI